jgi:hypothetical protein
MTIAPYVRVGYMTAALVMKTHARLAPLFAGQAVAGDLYVIFPYEDAACAALEAARFAEPARRFNDSPDLLK